MKKICFYFFTALTLAACGDELGSLNGGGVSLGGTGLPTSGDNTTPPFPTDQENLEQYVIWTKGLYSQICEDLIISTSFISSDTGEAILNSGDGTFVMETNENTPSNLTIVVTMKNDNKYPIYEYKNSCEIPVELKDQNQNVYEPLKDISCTQTTDEYQIIMPYQTITYNLKYQIPQKVQNWDLSYNSLYSINQLSPIPERKQCSIFLLDFAVERM